MVPLPTSAKIALSLALWDGASEDSRAGTAEAIAEALSHGALTLPCKFLELVSRSLAKQRHQIAEFECGTERFALVPGGLARLGWDGSPLPLTELQRNRWREQTKALDGSTAASNPEKVLSPFLTKARRRRIMPFLVELKSLSVRDYTEAADSSLAVPIALRESIAKSGARLATADEWEWACRGGESGFFRWGSRWPESTPDSSSLAFQFHRQPNGFGLELPHDTYGVECTNDFEFFVGGDGGTALQLERPPIECWCPLASAYRFPMNLAGDGLDCFWDIAQVRRVVPLAHFFGKTHSGS